MFFNNKLQSIDFSINNNYMSTEDKVQDQILDWTHVLIPLRGERTDACDTFHRHTM